MVAESVAQSWTVYTLVCQWCARTALETLDRARAETYRRSARCAHCRGPLLVEACHERPAELGVETPAAARERERAAAEAAGPEAAERRCADCGALTIRAERCRNCYLRKRYAENPGVRARQLALQKRWYERHKAAKGPS